MAEPEDDKKPAALAAVMETQEDIPETYRDLYTKKPGESVWRLTGITGVKFQDDVDRVLEAKRKESEDHKKTKAALEAAKGLLGPWAELTPEEVTERIGKYDELLIASKNKKEAIDDEAINQIVESRLKSRVLPIEQKLSVLTKERDEQKVLIAEYQQRENTRTVHDAVGSAAIAAKINPAATEDILLLAERIFEINPDAPEGKRVVTKEGVGVTPGVTPDIWLEEMKPKREHWWPPSEGTGARGSRGGKDMQNNPWSHQFWNVTEQGRYLTAHGREKADQLAKLAGTSVGGVKPAAPAATK